MTVSRTARKVVHTGNGVATEFAFEFIVLETADLKVAVYEIATETLTEIDSADYSVAYTWGDEDGGTVTYPLSGSPLASTHQIVIYRETALEQPINLSNQTRYYPEVVMEGFDRAILILQELKEALDRAVLANLATEETISYTQIATAVTEAEASATAAAASATAALAAENSLLEWQGPWTTTTAYAPSDLVSESGSAYVCLVAHTSGTFVDDLSASKWELFAAKGTPGVGTGDMLGANNLSDVASADTSLTNLGGTTVGKAVFKAVDAATGRTALGLGSSATLARITAADTIASHDNDTTIPTSAAVKDYADSVANTAAVLAAIAGASAGDVGTYIFAQTTGSDIARGSTISGAALLSCSAASRNMQETNTAGTTYSNSASGLLGTWRCMGTYDYEFNRTTGPTAGGATLWLRIS